MHGGFTHLAVHALNRPEPIRQANLLWVLASNIDQPNALVLGLSSLMDGGKGYWAHRIQRLSHRLQQGHALSEALRSAGQLLPDTTLLAIKVGESSGGLKQVLIEEAQAILRGRAKTRSLSFAWVLMMTCVFCLAVVFILTGLEIKFLGWSYQAILPTTVAMLKEYDAPIPPFMEPLITFGDWLRDFGWFLVFPIASLVFATLFFVFRMRFRFVMTGRWPFAGVFRRAWTPMILKSMAVSAAAGQTMSACLHALLSEMQPCRVSRSLSSVRQRIDSGEDFCESLCVEGFLTKAEAQFLQASFQTRHVDWGLLQLSDAIVQKQAAGRRILRSVLQPLVIISCGAFVFWLAAALMQPAMIMIQKAMQ